MTDIPHKFWKKYFESDELDKDKILEPILQGLNVSPIEDKKIQKHMLTIMLKSYLTDIEEYYESLLKKERRKMELTKDLNTSKDI